MYIIYARIVGNLMYNDNYFFLFKILRCRARI